MDSIASVLEPSTAIGRGCRGRLPVVLWNGAPLELPKVERPRGGAHPSPFSVDGLNLLVDRADDPLALRAEAAGRVVVETVDVHAALRRR